MSKWVFIFFLFIITFFTQKNLLAQTKTVTISGIVKEDSLKTPLSFVNILLRAENDSSFISGTITSEDGLFTLTNISSGNYIIEISLVGYATQRQTILVGILSDFLDLGTIELSSDIQAINEFILQDTQDDVSNKMDKKTYSTEDNITQTGGSVLQMMKNLPGITIGQDGKVQLRGSDKVTILIDGRQTAITGFGNQSGLDNIPASSVERIEIINNPSARYDANGAAGIINIILKKNKKERFNGKVGLNGGIGSLWIKRDNLPTIRPQFQYTPKINPYFSMNFRKKKINFFLQADLLWQKAINKNEFIDRIYDNDTVIHQQFLENRTQLAITAKTGIDWYIDDRNTFTFSALYSREGHIDEGDLPYFNSNFTKRNRLWLYYEDEVNTSVNASLIYNHKFKQPGHAINFNFNYTFHREDEKFSFSNETDTLITHDATMLIADENVVDLNVDYTKPFKRGRLELGAKLRWRYIPTTMKFVPGANTVLDTTAQGWANYNEIISAVYANYVYESKHFELEAGARVEFVYVNYAVTPTHPVYSSNGYNYIQPFPNLRVAYVINPNNRLSFFYNRRVDRPDEYDLRIFPKYDDPEILKTGNPALQPQYTQTFELGYKTSWKSGYFYSAVYYRWIDNVLTRIYTTLPGSTFINSISQNAKDAHNIGIELTWSQNVKKWLSFNVSLNGYYNIISAFTIQNVYPFNVAYSSQEETAFSGNAKVNGTFHLPLKFDVQLTAIYLAPDIIPQGRTDSRFSFDLGVKKTIQKGKGELFINATDLFNTFRIKKEIISTGFHIRSTDLYETQVIRAGYSYKF
jgi:outer membrane receptor protein involved in Fe transport